MEVTTDWVRGDRTGLMIPADAAALVAAGPDFLTRAFHAFGSLPSDNRVVRVVAAEPVSGGNSGHKLRLTLAYARPDRALDTELFVKFSRDFVDPFRDRRKYELDGEVRLALLARHPAFPVKVAEPWFADFDHASGTGLIITERIRFGEGAIEPLHAKFRDHLLDDPLAYYRTLVTALAQLVAAHQSGALAPLADELFPLDLAVARADQPFAFNAEELRRRTDAFAQLTRDCPRLFPANLREPAFLARFARDTQHMLARQDVLRDFLYADADFVALAHWNTNIDNAWFWREPDGTLHCGLLDWGMVRQMNVMLALWGGLSLALPAMLHDHLGELMDLYAAEIARGGGARLDPARMSDHFDLSVALVGMSMMLDIARIVTTRQPNIAAAGGMDDPMVAGDSVIEGFLACFVNIADQWERRDFGATFERVLASRA